MTTAEVPPNAVAAVERVLAEHGWNGLTTELIAEAAGINRVTLYRRGLTKERLVAAAALEASLQFQRSALPCLTASGNANARLRLLLLALYDLADLHLPLLAGLYDGPTAVFHLGIDPAETDVITRLEYTEPFERLLVDGNADGTLASGRPREDAELIFNTAGWTYVHLRRSHGWTPRRARPAVTRIATAFVAAPAPAAR